MKCLLLLVVVLALAQSLGDVARREAERRKNVQRGTQDDRVLTNDDVARLGAGGNVSVFSPAMKKPPPGPEPARGHASAARYRSALMKLDREIRSVVDRLESMKARAAAKVAAERWSLVGSRSSRSRGRTASGGKSDDLEIAEWTRKLERLKRDRLETYDAARRAGFLPGELEGKGVVP